MNVGVIPARSGSKGIENKNLAPLVGKPLIDYTLEAASSSKKLDRIILTTDSERIAARGKPFGIEVPTLRPSELAGDQTPMEAVLKHVLENDISPREDCLIVLLQPTSPLRDATDIDNVIGLHDSSVDTVVSVCRLHHSQHPESVMRREGRHLVPLFGTQSAPLRRQDAPILFARNGPAVLATTSELVARGILYGKRVCGYEMPIHRSVDINVLEDIRLAEALIRQRVGQG